MKKPANQKHAREGAGGLPARVVLVVALGLVLGSLLVFRSGPPVTEKQAPPAEKPVLPSQPVKQSIPRRDLDMPIAVQALPLDFSSKQRSPGELVAELS